MNSTFSFNNEYKIVQREVVVRSAIIATFVINFAAGM